MNIVWVVPRESLVTTASGVHSDLASIRYRAIIPIRGLCARGHQASVIGLDRACADEVRARLADADHAVFIKNYTDPVCSETILAELQDSRVRTWFDLTDDRFEAEAGEHLQRMVALAGRVVTVSAALRQAIAQHTGKDAAVVGDPFEGPRGEPRFAPGPRLRALWFGYGWNLQGLMQALPGLAGAGREFPLDLRIVTGGVDGLERYCESFNRQAPAAMTLEYVPWSREETWRSLEACDVVLIPALLDQPWTLAKSPNRIIEALWAGRFVVAHPIPSYREFGDEAWLGDPLAEGIAWVRRNQSAIPARIAAAQARIAAGYSPERIAQEWERLLTAS